MAWASGSTAASPRFASSGIRDWHSPPAAVSAIRRSRPAGESTSVNISKSAIAVVPALAGPGSAPRYTSRMTTVRHDVSTGSGNGIQ